MKKNSYKWWRRAKDLANISRSQEAIPDLIDDGIQAKNDVEKANMLARVFSKFANHLRGKHAEYRFDVKGLPSSAASMFLCLSAFPLTIPFLFFPCNY